jgi:hypothetical protein
VGYKPASNTKTMKPGDNFLAYVKSYLGNEALVFSCDNEGLRYLQNIFVQGFPDETCSSFKIGNDEHINSDGLCEIEIIKARPSDSVKIERKNDVEFVWTVPLNRAEDYRDMLTPMLVATIPCHQYFDPDGASSLFIIVTKDEYPIHKLRAMRDNGSASMDGSHA